MGTGIIITAIITGICQINKTFCDRYYSQQTESTQHQVPLLHLGEWA